MKAWWNLLKEAASEWVADKAPRLGAALSFYTIFAMPPLFIILLFIASLVFDPETVRSQLFAEVGGLLGDKSAEAIQGAMASQEQQERGLWASVIAVATLLLTATGLFIELQSALNTIWGVEAKSGQGIWGFVRTRLLSFAMVVGIGFLLVVSLVVTAAISALSKYVSSLVPGLDVLWMIANYAVAFAVITVLFAMIFKVLPDVKIAWRDVWIGALFTSFMFTAGKFVLGWYLGRSTVVSAYGAAGSLVLILLWVYYSAQILFFGAEIAQVYANRFGHRIEPSENAQWLASAKPQEEKSAQRKAAARAEREKAIAARPKPPAPAFHKGRNVPATSRRELLLAELKDQVENLREEVESLKR